MLKLPNSRALMRSRACICIRRRGLAHAPSSRENSNHRSLSLCLSWLLFRTGNSLRRKIASKLQRRLGARRFIPLPSRPINIPPLSRSLFLLLRGGDCTRCACRYTWHPLIWWLVSHPSLGPLASCTRKIRKEMEKSTAEGEKWEERDSPSLLYYAYCEYWHTYIRRGSSRARVSLLFSPFFLYFLRAKLQKTRCCRCILFLLRFQPYAQGSPSKRISPENTRAHSLAPWQDEERKEAWVWVHIRKIKDRS